MKKLVILFLILSSSLQAQSLYELMSEGQLKFGARTIDDVGINWNSSYQICGDDINCDLPVLNLHSNTTPALIHIDGEKLYKVDSSCGKLLFYDFSVNVGDTIREGVYIYRLWYRLHI